MSQCTMILDALRDGQAITPADAYRRFGCLRLAARIAELRREGHPIISRAVQRNGKRFAEYRLSLQ